MLLETRTASRESLAWAAAWPFLDGIMLQFDRVTFYYDPFPFGLIERILPDDLHRELAACFPEPELLAMKDHLGRRLSLSHVTSPKRFREFVRGHGCWRELHDYVRGGAFAKEVLSLLEQNHISFARTMEDSTSFGRTVKHRAAGTIRRLLRHGQADLVFGSIPADGGYLLPHTDHPTKYINLSIAMNEVGTWPASIGGETSVHEIKERRHKFNWSNRRAGFDEFDDAMSIPFTPNQGLLFIKTYDSWHSVPPLRGDPTSPHRNTVNIHISRSAL